MKKPKTSSPLAVAKMLDTQPDLELPTLKRSDASRESKTAQGEKPIQEAKSKEEEEHPSTHRALQKTRSSLQSSPRGPRGYLWPIRRALARTDRIPVIKGPIEEPSG